MTLNALLDGSAERFTSRTALVCGEESWSFARLRARVLAAAAAFEARGIKRGDCVALVLRNGPEFVTAYLALGRLGAAAVPVNFLISKPEELRFMLSDCAAAGIVTQKEFLKGVLGAREGLPRLRWVWATDAQDGPAGVEDFGRFVGAAGSPRAAGEVRKHDAAAILYTSGTTGTPKGVMLSHANLASNAEASLKALEISERDVTVTILPMFHTFAWMLTLASLKAGAKNLVFPSITPAQPWLKRMGRHGATVFAAVPPVYSVLAKEAKGLKRLALKYWFFRRVRFGVSGAAPLHAETRRAFEEAFGVPILEGYGLTETSPVATVNPPARPRPGSVGLPIDGVRIEIVGEDGAELPRGEAGEVCIQGPNVMLGYHNRPEANRETFTPEGFLKTGDIGVLDSDGYLYLRDRKKDMIIVKGLKVFSAQVEAVIAGHPAVQEAAVVGIPDASADETVKAFVTLKPGAAADKAELLKFCREKLDPYKRPRDVEIVESLPKNALQKVLKRVLRQQELEKKRT